MALSDSILLIRDYENIREILRDIYIFGCFSKEDFIKKGISGRKYDNEQRRISAYLPKHFVKKKKIKKKVLLYCSYHIEDSTKNYLADTYRNKSFTVFDIMAFFYVQQILYKKKELTLAELLEEIPIKNEKKIFTKDTLYTKLLELQQKGYITLKKEKNRMTYSLAKDIWGNFSNEELISILFYLEFMKNVSPIEMPYYFLYQKLKLYLICERKVQLENVEVFQFKHNHQFNSLDNEILLDIIRAIKQKKVICLTVRGKSEVIDKKILPIKIIHDSTYGRQYCMGISLLQNKKTIIRIDKIKSIQFLEDFTEEETELVQQNKNFENDCWCTSGLEEEFAEIVIQFKFKEKEERFIYTRIIREGHGGTIEKVEDGVYLYRNRFRDLREMIPWIRSFGERAKVISSDGVGIEQMIAQDWEKAVKKYETL